MKNMIYLLTFLLSVLFSCSDKNDLEIPEKKVPSNLGYFEGILNDTSYSINNEERGQIIQAGSYGRWSGYSDFYSWIIPLSPYKLYINLVPVKEGGIAIENGSPHAEYPYPCNYIYLRNHEVDPHTLYYPVKDPFVIWVDSVRFYNSAIPYIQGKMDGILYNVENPNDSIIITNAVFGIH